MDPKTKFEERGPAEHPDDDRMHINQGVERDDPRKEQERVDVEHDHRDR